MPGFLSRLGDNNGIGGKLVRTAKSVIASGLPVALNPGPVTPHPGGFHHKAAKTIVGPTDMSVIVEGFPVVKTGTKTTCGHPIITGTKTIIVP
jgi:uncharacterized Zn-binding protein involved in type VI secretion